MLNVQLLDFQPMNIQFIESVDLIIHYCVIIILMNRRSNNENMHLTQQLFQIITELNTNLLG